MYDGVFTQIQGRGQGPKGPKVVKYGPTPDRWHSTGSTEANCCFHIMNPWDPLQGVREPEFLTRPRGSVTGH